MSYPSIGVTTLDVTPPIGIFLAGYGGRHTPSDSVYHRLRAVCIAIDEGGGEPGLLVSIEWLGFYDRTPDARAKIAAKTGLAPERILLSGTHTHCGPVLRREMDMRRHGAIDEDYIERTLDQLADAAVKALADRKPSRLRVGTGWCGISSSRRRPDGQGGVQFKPSLDAPHDHQVEVLTIETPGGDVRHVLYSYACHPTSAGAITSIGGDYVTFASDWIEARYPGAVAAFFQGCAGDQKVDARSDDGGYRKLELEEVQAAGESLGRAVLRVLDADDLRPVEGRMAWTQQMLTLETAEANPAELRRLAQEGSGYVADWAQHHLDLIAARTPANRHFPFEVQTVRFGDALAIIALAGEMSVEFQLRFRRELGARYGAVWTLGYANEMVGYVPVRRQIPEGGYEVIDNNRHLLYTGAFLESTEETIAQAVSDALQK